MRTSPSPRSSDSPLSDRRIPVWRAAVLGTVLLVVLGLIPRAHGQQQEVPEEARQELQDRGMTVEEARRRARQLGIDLSNPTQAARRARTLGIPEEQVQTMLDAVQREAQQPAPSGLEPTVPSADTTDLDSLRHRRQQVRQLSRLDSLRQTLRRDSLLLDSLQQELGREDRLPFFGYNTFDRVPEAFRPSRIGPVDGSYVVSPGDELRLVVWGAAEFQYDLTVDREGRVYVPNVGQLTVAGQRLDSLRREMRHWLSQSYAGLETEPPTVSMDLTLTRLRPIKVFVLGEVDQPGGYTVSSYSTVFNALYSVGGPLRRGSLREIRVIRGGEVAGTIDFYDYLLQGYHPDPVQLQSGDHIFIPPRRSTVRIRGQVRRPAVYELTDEETLEDLIDYAGGLEAEAYTHRVHIERIIPPSEREDPSVARKVLDYRLSEVLNGSKTVPMADGDRVRILSISERTDNAVAVSGAVWQPGNYELSPEVQTIRDLIDQADGLTGEAYRTKADLVRVQENRDEKIISLDLEEVMNDVPSENIALQPEDSLRIYSVQEMVADQTVRIDGQVRYPGSYRLRDSMTVRDLLFRGGGLNDPTFLDSVLTTRADLFRRTGQGQRRAIYSFHLGRALRGEGYGDELLRPGDRIRIYADEVELTANQFVRISGSVEDPGRYEFQENMSMEDLILRAGGFTEGAYLEAVEVTRIPDGASGDGERIVTRSVPLAEESFHDSISFSLSDTTLALQRAREFDLEHRDQIFVRQDPDFQPQQTVRLQGEVRFPGQYTLQSENETLSEVIERAGGLRPTAYPQGGRLIRDTLSESQQVATQEISDAELRQLYPDTLQFTQEIRDSLLQQYTTRGPQQVIMNMKEAIAGQEGADIILQPGDEILIPSQPNVVAVRGNVSNEGLIKYHPEERVSYYLDRAGGTLDRTESILLTQASGATFEVSTGLFGNNPKVQDGAVIRVTRKPAPQESDFDLQETLTETMSILTSALTIIVLAQRVN